MFAGLHEYDLASFQGQSNIMEGWDPGLFPLHSSGFNANIQ